MLFVETINGLAKLMTESTADSPICNDGCFSSTEESRDDSKSVEAKNIDDEFKEKFTIAFDNFLNEHPEMTPGTRKVRKSLINELVTIQFCRSEQEMKMKTQLQLLTNSKQKMERELQSKILQVAKEKTESKIKLKKQLQFLWESKSKSERAMKHGFLLALTKQSDNDRNGLAKSDDKETETYKGKIDGEYVSQLENEVKNFRAENAVLTLEVAKLRKKMKVKNLTEDPKISSVDEPKTSQMLLQIDKVSMGKVPSHIYCIDDEKSVVKENHKESMNLCTNRTDDILREFEKENTKTNSNDEPRRLGDDDHLESVTDNVLDCRSNDEDDIVEPEGSASKCSNPNAEIKSLLSESESSDSDDEKRLLDTTNNNVTRVINSGMMERTKTLNYEYNNSMREPNKNEENDLGSVDGITNTSCGNSFVCVDEVCEQTGLLINEEQECLVTAEDDIADVVRQKSNLPSECNKRTDDKDYTSDEIVLNLLGNISTEESCNKVLNRNEERKNDENESFDDIFKHYDQLLSK